VASYTFARTDSGDAAISMLAETGMMVVVVVCSFFYCTFLAETS
jgi:hypothetical protein